MSTEPVEKSVVALDLSRFSEAAGDVDQHFGAKGVRQLEAQIHNLIERALRHVGKKMQDIPRGNRGDGAILVFETAELASRFAEALHLETEKHNQRKDRPQARRQFRVGISTGPVLLDNQSEASDQLNALEPSGMPVIVATRLQEASETGEVLIDADTWGNLPEDMRALYGLEEVIKDKHGERFHAHRRKAIAPPSRRPQRRRFIALIATAAVCLLCTGVVVVIWWPRGPEGPNVVLTNREGASVGSSVSRTSSNGREESVKNKEEAVRFADRQRGKDGSSVAQSKRVLIVIAPTCVWRKDYTPVRRGLEQKNVKVDVASTSKKKKKFVEPCDKEGGDKVKIDFSLEEVKADDYDAVFFPGSYSSDFIEASIPSDRNLKPGGRKVKELRKNMLEAGKPVSALGSGSVILAGMGVLKGKNVARLQPPENNKKLEDGDAVLENKRVVEADKIITARNEDDAEEFVETLLKALGQGK